LKGNKLKSCFENLKGWVRVIIFGLIDFELKKITKLEKKINSESNQTKTGLNRSILVQFVFVSNWQNLCIIIGLFGIFIN
jgi:hypothetical protein